MGFKTATDILEPPNSDQVLVAVEKSVKSEIDSIFNVPANM